MWAAPARIAPIHSGRGRTATDPLGFGSSSVGATGSRPLKKGARTDEGGLARGTQPGDPIMGNNHEGGHCTEDTLPLQQQQPRQNGTQPLHVELTAQESSNVSEVNAQPVVESERQARDVVVAVLVRLSRRCQNSPRADDIDENLIRSERSPRLGTLGPPVRPGQPAAGFGSRDGAA